MNPKNSTKTPTRNPNIPNPKILNNNNPFCFLMDLFIFLNHFTFNNLNNQSEKITFIILFAFLCNFFSANYS
jgi:hypothetical protein